jgi:hypothetical protein
MRPECGEAIDPQRKHIKYRDPIASRPWARCACRERSDAGGIGCQNLGKEESRLVVTQDKDFGELAFHIGLPADCGIVLFRLSGSDPLADNRRMVEVISARTDWAGHFAVADDSHIRIRPLPSVSPPAP